MIVAAGGAKEAKPSDAQVSDLAETVLDNVDPEDAAEFPDMQARQSSPSFKPIPIPLSVFVSVVFSRF